MIVHENRYTRDHSALLQYCALFSHVQHLNSEQYWEYMLCSLNISIRVKGIMSQTAARSESKRRDTAVLSGGATRTKLPSLSKQNPRGGGRVADKPQDRSINNKDNTKANPGKPQQNISTTRDTTRDKIRDTSRDRTCDTSRDRTRDVSRGRQEPERPEQKSRKSLVGAVNRAHPARNMAGTVSRAVAANRAGTYLIPSLTVT